MESALEGDLDVRGILNLGGARNGFENIRVTMRVKGDGTDEEMRELLDFAKHHSPVFDIVSNPVLVDVQLGLGPDRAAGGPPGPAHALQPPDMTAS